SLACLRKVHGAIVGAVTRLGASRFGTSRRLIGFARLHAAGRADGIVPNRGIAAYPDHAHGEDHPCPPGPQWTPFFGRSLAPPPTCSFQVPGAKPLSTSAMLMQPGTGHTIWHRLHPTHSLSSTMGTRLPLGLGWMH